MIPPLDMPVVSASFIGRVPQLVALDNWLLRDGQVNGQVVLVSGEAGIGKSRLARETRLRAAQQDWHIEQGACFEPDRSFPYAPLVDLLRHCLARYSSADAATLLGPLAGEVVKLLPELALTIPGLTPTPRLDPEAEKRRLSEALAQLISHLPTPLLLVVEDVHWSDDTSLEFLRYLARRLTGHPLLLLITYRSDELHPALQHFLAALDREQRPTEMALQRFTPPEVDALLRAIFAQERPIRSEFLDALVDLTDGNPFFIEEVLKALISAGDLFFKDGAWDRKPMEELRIPRSVQDAVQRRVAQLSETAQRSLAVAAVIGQQFDFATLQATTHQSETNLLAQLKEMLDAQLIIEVSAERFAFRHALTRQAVYSQLLARERQALHQQIGETVEGRYTDGGQGGQPDPETMPNASLSYHFYEAGDWAKTLTYARRAGEQAVALYTPWAAITHFTRAMRAGQQLQRNKTLPGLYRARGLAYETVGEFELARSDLETMRQLAQRAADRPSEWRALLDLGKLWASRDYAQTGVYFRRALELASVLDDPAALARSLNWVGNWCVNTGGSHEAQRCHKEALSIFQSLSDQTGIAQTSDLLGMAYFTSADPAQGAAYTRKAIEIFIELGDRYRLSTSLGTLIHWSVGSQADSMYPLAFAFADLVEWRTQALQIAQEMDWRAGEAYARIASVGTLTGHGLYDQALAMGKRALELAQEIEHRQWICMGHRHLGALYLELLALSEARRHLEQALALANEIGSMFHRQSALGHLILILILQGEMDEAETLLQSACSPELPMLTNGQRWIWSGQAEFALAQGEPSQALQIVDRLIASAPVPQSRPVGVISDLARVRGEALTALHRWEEAEAALLAACASAEAQESPRLIWPGYVALGLLYISQNRRTEAEQAFAIARTVIDRMAATVPDPALRDNFVRQAYARIPQPKALTPLQAAKQAHDGLTRRQRQVAALVAQGKTNREIAEILVLGVRTVEGHVGQILNKFGFTSRAQIAVWSVENEKFDF